MTTAPKRKFISARDVLGVLDHERQVILVLANDVINGVALDREQLERVADAGRRIERMKELTK